jgi:hypothetical protein
MIRNHRFALGLAPMTLCSFLCAQAPLTPGNLVVMRVGTGAAALSSAGQAGFVDEYTTAGVLVQSIPLPTAAAGTNLPFVNSGTATSEGSLNISTDGRWITCAGYNAIPGTTGVAASATTAITRGIARVDTTTGAVDTSTSVNNAFSANNPRSAITENGTQFWMSGGTSGVQTVTLGATTSTAINTTTPLNNRILGVFNGQLYTSSASNPFYGISTVGVGLPNATGQSIVLLSGFPTATGPSPYDFFFADSNTLYVADDRLTTASGGIQKWTRSGTAWTLAYTIPVSIRYMTVQVSGGVATIYGTSTVTSANSLVQIVDTGAGSTSTTLVTAAANTVFRGVRLLARRASVAFSGTGSPTSVGTPSINTTGMPYMGNSSFAITAGGMPAFGFGFLTLGLGNVLTTGIPVPGAPATLNLYVNPIANTSVVLADGSGNAAQPLPLPATNSLLGLPLAAQVIAYDSTLTDPLPLGASVAMQVLLGQW